MYYYIILITLQYYVLLYYIYITSYYNEMRKQDFAVLFCAFYCLVQRFNIHSAGRSHALFLEALIINVL